MSEWYVEGGGKYIIDNKQIFGRNIYVSTDEVYQIRNRFKNTDCFTTVFMYKGPQQESVLYGPLYIDMDYEIKDEASYKQLKMDYKLVISYIVSELKVPIEYIKIYFSGNKGFHILIPPEVLDIKPDKNLNNYYKTIAKKLKDYTSFKTVDTRIYDNRRLFRLNNSINSSTGLYKVPVTDSFVRSSSLESMKEYALEPKGLLYPKVKTNIKAKEKFKEIIKEYEESTNYSPKSSSKSKMKGNKKLLPCMQAILLRGVSKGNRNNVTMMLSSSMFQSGFSLDEVVDILHDWNIEKNDPNLSDSELMTTIRSAYKACESKRYYGCSSIKDMGLCVPDNCKLSKSKGDIH